MPATTPRLDGAFVLRYRYISHVLQGRPRAGFEREAQYWRDPERITDHDPHHDHKPDDAGFLFVHGGLDMSVHRPSSI